jgi:predicted nucleic acid-binding protein
MIAVSNTTPLRYLIAIGQDNLLGRLFDKVYIRTGVHEELTDPRTPEAVRRHILSLPTWLEVRAVRETLTAEFPVTLHRGERESILLAETLRADVLLIDEQIGRTIAMNRSIPLSGTLGVLERADLMSLLDDFPQVLKQLKASGFFMGDPLEHQLLQRHDARRIK